MQKELEVTFSKVDHDTLREIIRKIGAKCIQEKTLMRRVVFRSPTNPDNSFFRLRDEGNKVTCTYKIISSDSLSIDSVQELETEVQDFEVMKQILVLSGLKIKAYQETYRETWRTSDDVYFMLDEWPGIQPFIEIEGQEIQLIKKYSEALGFDYNAGIFGAVDQLYYLELGIEPKILNTTPEITFQNPPKKYI